LNIYSLEIKKNLSKSKYCPLWSERTLINGISSYEFILEISRKILSKAVPEQMLDLLNLLNPLSLVGKSTT
jgi:hypothetical protein